MWIHQVLRIILLGCCGFVFVSGGSVQTEGKTVANDDDVVTLSTELKPPPLPSASEHRGIVYLVNQLGARNKTTDISEENGENIQVDNGPEIIGPTASAILVDQEENKKITSDDLTGNLGEDYATAQSTDSKKTPKEIGVETIVSENRDVAVGKLKMLRKIRSKRTPSRKCYSCGGGGGGGYGGYPNRSYGRGGGYGAVGIPVFVVPIGVYGGGGGGGWGKGHHGGGGGGGNYGGGGYYPVGGGWGGGSQASAQASAQSSSWSY
ncbi:keratin, type II cytoskeletal 1-like [Neodiprion virginianus]|uniref:keratin, type II cytoskeletal 1-like n=1 Tax=Neodiprion virginianus TaxID=2961670 RepID=UPI001EE7520E|nr:keratin, type II cytoskeletal 1-like [Neodiprion virginianus]